MSDKPSLPLADLAFSFEQAVVALHDWRRREDEPTISYGAKMCTVGTIADIASLPTVLPDTAPANIYQAVLTLAQRFHDGPELLWDECDGPKDHSYASVANCLGRLYRARRSYYSGQPRRA